MRKGEWWFNNMETPFTNEQRVASQRGQTFLIIAVFIAFFLLAVMGLATDYGQIWAHRQIVQAAADAACQAGAADLLLKYQDPTVSSAYPQVSLGWVGTAYNCSTNTGSSPCQYAALNGYSGSNVKVSFPGAPAGAPSISGFPGIGSAYIQVSITDPVPMFFTKLLSPTKTFNIAAKAICGMVAVNAPVPITVLNPGNSGTLSMSGSKSSITIYGGPQRSIQVNSHSATALSAGGVIDLSQAGPSFTGADMGVFGGPATKPGSVNVGSTGHYLDPAAPIGDPYATVPAPKSTGMPVRTASGSPVVYGTNGCPDTGGCLQFLPGNYTGGLSVGPGPKVVAIFDPGIYYVNGGIHFNSNSILRPSAANATTAPYGEMFYLTGCTSTCITVNSDSGSKTTTDNFVTSTLTCPGGTTYTPPPGVIMPTQGNMLLAPCTGPYGNATGVYRGILFFVDRSISSAGAAWSGGGAFILAGSIYSHNTATSNDTFSLGGNSGSTSLVIGNIVTDQLGMNGNPNITMQLDPNATYPILKVELLQ
jgi:Putative Flp pilus-assembly TadE/G-like